MYQALYRKYRPQVFSDVYGQDHVTSTLINEINEGRVSHAYLFTGSRGTGKTTCAKILAKAVNCANSKDGEPCNECEICKGIDEGTLYDVVEIDAASNNGVDNIRELREEVNYTPTRGKYRVYIIDEVHMLSPGAFNALLKTLEEPPSHVIFILATTEVHKLPATILSRCQRFDFKRIQPETMAKRLNEVAKMEELSMTQDAAILIARIADGALRDGLSILDQCAGRGTEINAELVSNVAGLAGRESLYDLSAAISEHNSSNAISIIAELHNNSYDMERLCIEMINHFRNFLIVKTVKKNRELIICTDDEYNTIVSSAEKFTTERVVFALDLFQAKLVKIKGGANSRVEMEMAFISLCEPKLDTDMAAVLDRISSLEHAVKLGIPVKDNNFTASKTEYVDNTTNIDKTPVVKPNKTENVSESIKEVISENVKGNNLTEPFDRNTDTIAQNDSVNGENDNIMPNDLPEPEPNFDNPQANTPPIQNAPTTQQPFREWSEFMDIIHKTDIAIFGLLNGAKGYIRDEFFLIDSPNPTIKEFISISTHSRAIKSALYELTGIQYKLGIFKQKKAENDVKKDPLDDLISKAKESNINVIED